MDVRELFLRVEMDILTVLPQGVGVLTLELIVFLVLVLEALV